jgi:thioredoxin 1
MSKSVHALKDIEFKEKIAESKGLALIDFWAEWCGPCRVVGPIIDAVAEAHPDTVRVYKMNVDENPKTPAQFNIRGIPTVIIFKDGKVVDQIVGSQPREVFEQAIRTHLA